MLPTVLLLVGGTAYGSVFAANKIVIEAGFPFIAYTFWQACLAALFYLALTALLKAPPKLNPAHIRQYAVTSFLGIVAPVLMLTFAAGKLPAGVVILVIALTPALTYVFAFLLRIERFRGLSIGGVIFGFAGVLLIVLPEGGLPNPEMVGWLLAALIVPLAFATNNVFIASTRPVDAASSTLACGLLISATVVTLPIMLIEHGFYVFWQAPAAAQWGLVWAAAVQALVIYCLFEIIRRAGPVFFAQFNYVIVITGFLWALALFDENLGLWIWVALGVMIVGLVLAHAGTAQAMRETATKIEGGDGA
jgi:drug/metabolite transporter (DMT)-like permease